MRQQEKSSFTEKGQGAPTFDAVRKVGSVFEPHVAEAIFDAMVREAGVKLIKGRLDLDRKAEKAGTRITRIYLEDGHAITGKMFIDASYEGDLLEAAGVSFTVGRESNEQYGESGNGNTGVARKNQLRKGIDPYKIPGKPESGLLAGVNADLGGETGSADHRLQAYCYRMVLTDAEDNRIMVEKPDGYKEEDYELLFRSIEVGQKWGFFKTSPMPNRKTDSNNTGGISCDFIGMNYSDLPPDHKDYWDWTTLGHKEREAVAMKHRLWQLGLVWTVQNHPRVPEDIRKMYAKWGLPKDEFKDNEHWPYNLYVREGRRMISDLVMTEAHCRNQKEVPESVGKGAYTLDSHNTQRVVHDGMVRNEGDIQLYLGGKPYAIGYRSIIPRKGECENLLVPWCLSSSHIAFGSIRMEPVGMILGQSAATAASLAIDQNVSVQDLDYELLKARLLKDGQKL